jgi:hypothetical protein
MSVIFNYISNININHADNYEGKIEIHIFSNTLFRTHQSNYYNFQTQLGIHSNKIISITNRQLSFLVNKYHHFLGHEYASDLQQTYSALLNTPTNSIIYINEPVFLFFDYDACAGGHMYDLLFYLLYVYKKNNLTEKLLVIETTNVYYNNLLHLIKKYFNIDYIFIKPDVSYSFSKFSCVRTYQNIFFNKVKEFVNNNLITPIIKKFEHCQEPFYKSIIKIKTHKNTIFKDGGDQFEETDNFKHFLAQNKIYDMNTINDDEELKIYLINKCDNIIISWASTYYININYYLLNSENKFISVIFHKKFNRNDFLIETNKAYIQYMPLHVTGGINDNYYNSFTFKGEVIDNLTNINDFIERTKLLF